MSNYPPGVSGNEFEISGADNEWEEEFQCDNDDFEYVMISPYAWKYLSETGKLIHTIKGQEEINTNWYHRFSMINAMINYADMTTEIQHGKCGFVGDVLKQSYRGEIWWDCPQCGKRYEEDNEQDYYGYED